ncbi:arginine--tRNA ligase [Deinococcus cellulosilyticus]|uniref:Arginine--tRNA ligase n=1 Tax=Deinococcus cellulosilyticus (strain DSM 18568 / NBRC 106333 / KACC 11606 / 5516J-15) TaxID=1223518 RepID=A0A511MZQ4_DEIC1|nr:arginine--tRNA ligase [Deinococcus cellulosilyticus]GEM46074.1 arginine--tRNA ligase [Deinococcus cellulosilyticus NBRC 106333 = KACC 11606]
MNLKDALRSAVQQAIAHHGLEIEVAIQETPADKPGDYGTPVAFQLAKALKKNPVQIAAEIKDSIQLPVGIARAENVGPYLNFFVDVPSYVRGLTEEDFVPPAREGKVLIEHTSVNPNKELHVGHLRNVVLGDAMSRIFRANGYQVEVQNYIDDTGRQAAESLFAREHYGASYMGEPKYDHWLGELYVRLNADPQKADLEPGIREVMHKLEAGELREEIEEVLHAHLETCHALGAEYDLLVWESDIVGSGFLAKAMKILEESPYCSHPTEGKYAGCFVMDVSSFIPGLEDPNLVLIRSDGTATYTAKDIAQQFWKFGLFEGLEYKPFTTEPSGKTLYTTHPQGKPADFAHATRVINVIDARQKFPQTVVKTSLAIAGHQEAYENSFHLAYETVLLEGQTISGRKGITVSVDEVLEEARTRAKAALKDIERYQNPEEVAEKVGLGALRFSMLKSEPGRQIDFRWEAALALNGDTAPYVQYAAVRAQTILKKAQEAGLSLEGADYSKVTDHELALLKSVARYPEVLDMCVRDTSPHHLVQYALDLATELNGWYNKKDKDGKPATRVIDADAGLREARLNIVLRVRKTLEQVLGALGIGVPSEM